MKKLRVLLFVLGLLIISPAVLQANTTVFSDTFDKVSSTLWHIPTWSTAPGDGSFLGRTQLRVSQDSSLPSVSGSNVKIILDSYNPTGFSFYGTDLISNQTFSPGANGIIMKVRAKFDAPQPGVVGGIFLYDLKPGSVTLHDEIDFEIVGNVTNKVQANIYASEPLGAGHSSYLTFPTGLITDYHTYEIRWLPTEVSWYVDGTLLRTEKTFVPQGPMKLHLNIWAPDTDWAEAYNSSISPVRSASANKTYTMSVDSVTVESIEPVVVPVLKTITLSPLASSLNIAGTQQITATTLDQNGKAIAATLTWKSSNTAVATVSSTGLVTAVSAGTANITASSSAITSTAPSVITVAAPKVLKTITLSPLTASLNIAGTQQVTATTLDQNGSAIAATLTWKSSNTSVATVNSTGLVTAVGAGTANITASSGTITSSAPSVITVAAPKVLKTITLSPLTASLNIAGTQQVTATTLDQNGSAIAATLTWKSSNTTVATVSSTGLVTAVSAGTANITVSSGTINSTAPSVITVVAPTLKTITLSPLTSSLSIGGTQQIAATTLDQNSKAISATLTWKSSNTAIATVNASGLVTAVSAGTANITASSGTINSTVPSVITVATTGIKITSTPKIGQTGNAVGTISGLSSSIYSKYSVAVFINVAGGWWNKPYFNTPTTTIKTDGTWTTNIVTGGSDQNATEIRAYLIPNTFALPLTSGAATIPTTLGAYPFASVTRQALTLTTISISPSTASLTVGGTQKITASTLDQNGSAIAATLTWASSNTAVATVDSTGFVKAIGAGTANITASSGTVKSGASAITVTAVKVLKTITLSPSVNNLTTGDTTQITATTLDQNGSAIAATLTWTSSNTSVATVSSTGFVTAVGAGTANITASSGSIAGSASITVVAKPTIPAKITITNVPKYNASTGNAQGKISGVTSSQYKNYKVLVYIKVAGQWWTKPYWNKPDTKITTSGSWTADITTGTNDKIAKEIRAYVVPLAFNTPLANGETTLPSSLTNYPSATVLR